MFNLLNNCWRTEIKVNPANWHTSKASEKKEWYVWYRFHDPSKSAQHPKGKLVIIKGMNSFKDRKARQKITTKIIEDEKERLDLLGYNPITLQYMATPPIEEVVNLDLEITTVSPETGLIPALNWAYKQSTAIRKDDQKSVLKYFTEGAAALNLSNKPILEVSKRDIKLILDETGRIKEKTTIKYKNGNTRKGSWSANNYNHYLGNLGSLFKELEEYQVYDVNPIQGLSKKDWTTIARPIVSDSDEKTIANTLKSDNYNYWRYLQLFRASGARRTEFTPIQDKHVDLENRVFKVWVMKGKHRWEEKFIDDEVLALWEEIIGEALALRNSAPSDQPIYLFSEGLEVSYRDKPIRPEQVTRRWRTHVKKKMSIKEDQYSLKHKRTTNEIDEFIEEVIAEAQKRAAKKNSHTSTRMVKAVYDIKSEGRKAEIRKIINKVPISKTK